MFNMWPIIVVKVPMVVLVYCIGKILSCWSVGQQFYASTIWLAAILDLVIDYQIRIVITTNNCVLQLRAERRRKR